MRSQTRRPWWLAIAFVLGLQLAFVPAARACSCAQPGPMADYRGDPGSAILTAIVEPRDARGFPATVTRWFQGGILEPRVWFDAASFSGNDGMCGIDPLPVATEWIFVAYRIEGRQEFGTGLCSPHGPLTGPDGATGQAMLADALRAFGGAIPATNDPSPNAVPTTAPPVQTATSLSIATWLIAAIASIGVLAGVVAIVRGRRNGAA